MSFAPLAGLRVLDVTTAYAGPICSQLLAALGADVVKIESPGRGDPARSWGPPFIGGDSAVFLSVNAGKRSLALDLRRGRDVVLRLVDGADVFLQGLRPGLAEKLGLGLDDLRTRNERLIYCSIGAFGRSGPLRDAPGYDALAQAASGIISVTGERGRPGVRVGVSMVDHTTGMWAGLGILAAIIERGQIGKGRSVDVSLFESGLGVMGYHLMGFLATGEVPRAEGTAFPLVAPYEVFAAEDGGLMVTAGTDKMFRGFVEVVGLPELADDPRFITNSDRVARRTELADLISPPMRAKPRSFWLDKLTEVGVPAAPVLDVAEVASDEQTRALDILETRSHRGSDVVFVAPPLSADSERVRYRSGVPALGEHTAEVLTEAGYGVDELAELADAGIIGTPSS